MITITSVSPGFSVPLRQPSLEVEHAATMPIANSSSGTARMMSVVREISVSAQPPRKPAMHARG